LRSWAESEVTHWRPFSSASVTLPHPKASSPFVKFCGIGSIETNLLIVEEVNAPERIAPIHWTLMASPGFFKTGSSIEIHALRKAARLQALIALMSVIGVRRLSLKTSCRHEPEAKAKDRVPGVLLKVLLLTKPKPQSRT
jgi:hypothetical protein